MRSDYEPLFRKLKARLPELGYHSVEEHELSSLFKLYSGWMVEFACERYYSPAYELFLLPPGHLQQGREKYGVALLMMTLEKILGEKYGKPTLDNEIDFLIREKQRVFNDPAFYETEYAKLNDIDGS